MISASEAKKQAAVVKVNGVTTEIEKVDAAIKEAVVIGALATSIEIPDAWIHEARAALHDNGYETAIETGNRVKIFWSK